ncbi:hypothetical protein RRG08_003107 [Elysia crispata]|uniref:Uncharacterized protein n=1 Tax=Elysia crispata TaxID=231223 RepID=A0AAE1EAW2_9GAST|nr:hypothetical protein RRG08_003107 [Elysia crispata]
MSSGDKSKSYLATETSGQDTSRGETRDRTNSTQSPRTFDPKLLGIALFACHPSMVKSGGLFLGISSRADQIQTTGTKDKPIGLSPNPHVLTSSSKHGVVFISRQA